MAGFTVDPDAVSAATGAVRGSMGTISAEVAALAARLEALQGSWGGQAATAFQGVVAEWRATQLRVEEALGAIGDALDAAGRVYADTEQAALRLFSR